MKKTVRSRFAAIHPRAVALNLKGKSKWKPRRATLRDEHQLIVAEGDYLIAHGRFSGTGRPVAWVSRILSG